MNITPSRAFLGAILANIIGGLIVVLLLELHRRARREPE